MVDSKSKRIAKNTLFLYFRSIVVMLIGLYTSRVILAALGESDYGIYNVVGGVVAMLSMFTGSLSSAISRFITFELGKGSKENLQKIFSSSITIQWVLSLIVIVLAETIGLWFLNTYMNIPEERMVAANWVYQFSIITFVISLLSVPYNAEIIANERMSAFAYIGLFDAFGKLLIAFFIVSSPIDRLVFYAILMCLLGIIVRCLYALYCRKHFEECRYSFTWDRSLLKEMFGFAGWNLIGVASSVLRDHGGNILINIFFGPVVNAARGIAYQVNSAVSTFVSNFMTALNPQITKSYALGDKEYMMKLIFHGARFSFYILLMLSLPILVNTDYILALWLKDVPEHTVLFVQLVLILAMSESISHPLVTAMLATGNIRNYQLVVGGLQLLNLPISYVFLRIGAVPETVMVVAIVISQCCLAARLVMLRKMIGLKVRQYFKHVYLNILIVCLLALIIPVFLRSYLASTFLSFCISVLVCLICTSVSICFVGCDKSERRFIYDNILSLKEKLFNRR